MTSYDKSGRAPAHERDDAERAVELARQLFAPADGEEDRFLTRLEAGRSLAAARPARRRLALVFACLLAVPVIALAYQSLVLDRARPAPVVSTEATDAASSPSLAPRGPGQLPPPASDELVVPTLVGSTLPTDSPGAPPPQDRPEPEDELAVTESDDLGGRDEGDTELLARIEMERGASVAAVDRLELLAEFHARYPNSEYAEEVLALTVEARAEAGLYSEALDASRRYREQFPDGPRIQQVYWIEGTVARDRLHDCARALPSYRALMADGGVYQARAAYFCGLCALDTGDTTSGREALEEALRLGLGGSEADNARELLGGR